MAQTQETTAPDLWNNPNFWKGAHQVENYLADVAEPNLAAMGLHHVAAALRERDRSNPLWTAVRDYTEAHGRTQAERIADLRFVEPLHQLGYMAAASYEGRFVIGGDIGIGHHMPPDAIQPEEFYAMLGIQEARDAAEVIEVEYHGEKGGWVAREFGIPGIPELVIEEGSRIFGDGTDRTEQVRSLGASDSQNARSVEMRSKGGTV